MRYPMKRFATTTLVVLLLGVIFAPGCGGGNSSSPSQVSVAVTVNPVTATVNEGATQQFNATVIGSTNTAVNWSVQEGSAGGTISSSGLYTAPQTAGTYHVVATSQADTSKTGSATVTVPVPPNPVPAITGISPMAVTPGHAGFILTVTGTNFVSGASVLVNGASRTTTFVSATTLTATISAGDVATAGNVTITVSNPAPGGGVSNALSLTVSSTVSIAALAQFKITGTPNDLFGSQVKWLGNISGTAACSSALAIPANSGVYVLCNPESHLGTSYTLADLGTSKLPGFKMFTSGPLTGGTYVVAGGGDVNHDGINDIVVCNLGATTDNTNLPGAGVCWAVMGGSSLATLTSLNLTDASKPIVTMAGVGAHFATGQTLADLRDFNGDGYADIAFGVPAYGYQTSFNSGPGAVDVVFGRGDFFSAKSINLTSLEQAGNGLGKVYTRSTSTPISLAAGLGSASVNFLGDLNGDGLSDLSIGDPAAQNAPPNTQTTYVMFSGPQTTGKFFVENRGRDYPAATMQTTGQGCSQPNGYCNQQFGSNVVGRDGSWMVSDIFGGILNSTATDAIARGGMVTVMHGLLSNNQVVDIRTAAVSNLWDYSLTQERMGYALVDGADFVLVSTHLADSSRGKVLVLPGSGLPVGNQNVASVTRLTVTGEVNGDAFGAGLQRLGTDYIAVSAPGGGKVYILAVRDVLF